MTMKQYRDALEKLGLSQRYFAKLIGRAERTSRRYALKEAAIPESVAILLRLMLDGIVTAEQIKERNRS